MTRLPRQLQRPPLVEAVFELRFSSSQESVGDLLPGLLYGKLKHLFERSEALPLGAIPKEVREKEGNFRYRPHIRLVGKSQAILVGDHMVSIAKNPPYSGWATFKGLCQEVLEAVQGTELLNSLERFSFKCVNVLELAGRPPFAMLNAVLTLGQYALTNRGLQLRVEIDHRGFINIVELGATVKVDVGQESWVVARFVWKFSGCAFRCDGMRREARVRIVRDRSRRNPDAGPHRAS